MAVDTKFVAIRSPKLLTDAADICKLIRLYHANECLWNPKSTGYHNLALKENAWHRIALFFKGKLTVDQVKLQMLSLRCYYDTERLAIARNKQRGFEYEPRHSYYENLEFLKDVELDIGNEDTIEEQASVCKGQINCIVEDAFLLSSSENSIHSEHVDFRVPFLMDNDSVMSDLPVSIAFSVGKHRVELPLPPLDIKAQRLDMRAVSGNDRWHPTPNNFNCVDDDDDCCRKQNRSPYPRHDCTYSEITENNRCEYDHRQSLQSSNVVPSSVNPDWTGPRHSSQPVKKVLTGRYRTKQKSQSILESNRLVGNWQGNSDTVCQKSQHITNDGRDNRQFEYNRNVRNSRDLSRKASREDGTFKPKNNPLLKYVDPNSALYNTATAPYMNVNPNNESCPCGPKPERRPVQNQEPQYCYDDTCYEKNSRVYQNESQPAYQNDEEEYENEYNDDDCDECEGYCTTPQGKTEYKNSNIRPPTQSQPENFQPMEANSQKYYSDRYDSEYEQPIPPRTVDNRKRCRNDTCPKLNIQSAYGNHGNQSYENQIQPVYENQNQPAYENQNQSIENTQPYAEPKSKRRQKEYDDTGYPNSSSDNNPKTRLKERDYQGRQETKDPQYQNNGYNSSDEEKNRNKSSRRESRRASRAASRSVSTHAPDDASRWPPNLIMCTNRPDEDNNQDTANEARADCPAVKRRRMHRSEKDDLESPERKRRQRSSNDSPDDYEYAECPAEKRRQRFPNDHHQFSNNEKRYIESQINSPRQRKSAHNSDDQNMYVYGEYERTERTKSKRRRRDDENQEYPEKGPEQYSSKSSPNDNNSYPVSDQPEYEKCSDINQTQSGRSSPRNGDRHRSNRHKERSRNEEYDQENIEQTDVENDPKDEKQRQRKYEGYTDDLQTNQKEPTLKDDEYSSDKQGYKNEEMVDCYCPTDEEDPLCCNKPANKEIREDKEQVFEQVPEQPKKKSICYCEASVETDLDMTLNMRNRNVECKCVCSTESQNPATAADVAEQKANNDNNNNSNEATDAQPAGSNKPKVTSKPKKSKICRCTPPPLIKNRSGKSPGPVMKTDTLKTRSASPTGGKSRPKRYIKQEDDSTNDFQAIAGKQPFHTQQEGNQYDKSISRQRSGYDVFNKQNQSQPRDGLSIICSFEVPPTLAKKTFKILNSHISNVAPEAHQLSKPTFNANIMPRQFNDQPVSKESHVKYSFRSNKQVPSSLSCSVKDRPVPKTSNPFRNLNFNASKRNVIILHPPVKNFRASKYSFSLNDVEQINVRDCRSLRMPRSGVRNVPPSAK